VLIDVTDRSSIDDVIARIDGEVGALHGVVNNAGISVVGPVELLDEMEWREQFDVNFFGAVAVTRAAFPLVRRGHGRFVHVGSIQGRVAIPGNGPYGAAKHALEAVNWVLRAEMARDAKVTSSIIEPGVTRTAIFDKGGDQIRAFEERLASLGATEHYAWLIDVGHGFLAAAAAQAMDPDRVARTVEHALTTRRPRARYLVGLDSRIQATLALLPDWVRERTMSLLIGWYERGGRTRLDQDAERARTDG